MLNNTRKRVLFSMKDENGQPIITIIKKLNYLDKYLSVIGKHDARFVSDSYSYEGDFVVEAEMKDVEYHNVMLHLLKLEEETIDI